jgi:hypothetical protein
MPPSSTPSTSVQINFYNSDGTLNTDFNGQLSDNRSDGINLTLSGDSSQVLTAQLYVDSATATNTATLKTYKLNLGGDNIIKVGQAGETDRYLFVNDTHYSLKVKIMLNTTGFPTCYGKFTISGAAQTTSYNYLYTTTVDTISSATVTNPDSIQNDSSIVISAPMNFVDTRRPVDMVFTFDVFEYSSTDDNSGSLAPYVAVLSYSSDNTYTLTNNQLVNDNKYACTVTAVYADGWSTSKNVVEPVYVVTAPVINTETSVAYGLDDKLDAGDQATSTVAIIKLEPGSTPVNITLYDGNVTFHFKQGNQGNLCYSASIVASITDTYTIMRSDLVEEGGIPVQNSDAVGSFNFDVTALIIYNKTGGTFTKVSNIWADNYTMDVIPLTEVSLENAWISTAVTTVGGSRMVDNDNTTSMTGYAAAPEFGLVGKFQKNNFFGNGGIGLLNDLDTTDTQFKFEITVNSGPKIDVPKLALMKGYLGEGAFHVPVYRTNQENYTALLAETVQTLTGGKVDNVPLVGSAVLGSQQPDLYFTIPQMNGAVKLYEQDDNVKVTVSITSKTKGITLAQGTVSNAVKVVHKVNTYTMGVGSDSEPRMSGSGVNAVLTVPINNPTTKSTGDYYLASSTFKSNLTAPNNSVTVTQSGSGVFDMSITNPVPSVTSSCTYQVAYNIADPNGSEVRGPLSQAYTVRLSDEPTAANNLSVTNYTYTTFGDATGPKVAGFTFDIEFKDVAASVVDGVHVYFKKGSDLDLVKTVMRGPNDVQTGINVVLQSTPPDVFDSSSGVNVMDSAGDVGVFWNNWSKGEIVFKAFKTPLMESATDAAGPDSTDSASFDIFNIPPISAPTDFVLNGGVKEMYKETSVQWMGTLSVYGTDVTPSYVLTLSEASNVAVDKSADVLNFDLLGDTINYYNVDIQTLPADTEYKLALKIKLVGTNGYAWYGTLQTITFNSVSVDESSRAVSVKRGSAITVLKASFSNNTTDPAVASNLVHVERKLVDNVNNSNNPENPDIQVLENGAADAVQADTLTHTYNLLTAGYARGDVLNLQVRSKVSVTYTLTTGPGAPAPKTSTGQYVSLAAAPKKTYTVAGAPVVTVGDSYTVQNGKISIPFTMDANGLAKEGFSALTAIIAQESDLTDAGDANSGNGGTAIVTFSPDSNVLIPGIRGLNGVSTNLTDAQMTTVKADSTLAVTTTGTGVNGWAIKNPAAVNGVVPKVNLYYYTNAVAAASQTSSNSFTFSQASGLGMYALFNQNSGAKQFPFFIAYTTPTAADNKSSWYKSKVFYAPASGSPLTANSPLNAGLTLSYTGTDDLSFHPEIPIERRVRYEVILGSGFSNANAGYNDELVNLLSLQTSSNAASTNAGDFDFQLLETGMNTNHASFGLVSLKYNVYSEYSREYIMTEYGYDLGLDASATDVSDYLAAGEIRTSIPENLSNGASVIETGEYTLTLGNLTSTDQSKISFLTNGFILDKTISVVFIASTRLGTAVKVNAIDAF